MYIQRDITSPWRGLGQTAAPSTIMLTYPGTVGETQNQMIGTALTPAQLSALSASNAAFFDTSSGAGSGSGAGTGENQMIGTALSPSQLASLSLQNAAYFNQPTQQSFTSWLSAHSGTVTFLEVVGIVLALVALGPRR